MRVSKVWKGCVAAFGAAAAVAVACGTFTQASAAEAEYKIYPTPHEVTYGQGVVDFEGTVNTIVGDGIDGYTVDRLDEVLELAGVTAAPAEATSDDGEGIEILVGIEGSGDAADAYVTEGPSADLFTKTDAYYLAVEPASGDAPDRIVVLGKDTDSAFYGLSTLYQILQQDTDGDVAALTMSDWADVETRGFIEGYYGNPWSTEDRCELMRWGGYYKLNAYIYAPKDDPKHNHDWRDLYTTEELEDIAALSEAGNASKCRFIYALHPFMYDALAFGSSYEQDLADLKAKYLQVIDAGCRQIMLSADDASDQGSTNYLRLLNDLTNWIHELQAEKNEDGTLKYEGLKDIIPFVAANYASAGESWYSQLPDNVRPIMTGTRVWGKADNSTIAQFINKSDTEPFMWINWPCTDNTRDHLSMGGYENALGADVMPGTLQGCVINPMQQSEASKVGIFMNADFSWNNWTSYDHADQTWQDAFSYVDNGSPNETEASNALRTLSEHMKWYQGGGVTFASRESQDDKPMLDAFKSKLQNGSVTMEDVEQARAFFDELSAATDVYDANPGNAAMREQIDPWILFWQDTTYAAENYLDAIEGALNGDVTALISGYTKAVEAYNNAKDHGFDYVGAVQYARAGTYAVQPCVDAMADYVAAQASLVAGGAGESVARVSADGLSVYESYSLDKIIDGNESTQAWLTGTRSDQGIDVGNSFTVTYAPAKTVEQITLVEGQGDKLAGGVIEYQVEGSSEWVEAGATTGPRTTIDLDEAVEITAIRVRCTTGAKQWWQVYELIAGEKGGEPVEEPEYTASVQLINTMAHEGSPNLIIDGNTSNFFWTKSDESGNIRKGDGFQVNYEPYALVGQITLEQGDPSDGTDAISKGVVEYTTDGQTWHTAGTIDNNAPTFTFTFPSVNVRSVRVVSTENQSVWWKIRELSVAAGATNPAGSIVTSIDGAGVTGSATQGVATISGGEVSFAADDYLAVDLGAVRPGATFGGFTLPEGFEFVTSANGLGWTSADEGAPARYVGVRYTGEGEATLDLSTAISVTYNYQTSVDFVATSSAEDSDLSSMLDNDITTYWRGGEKTGELEYIVSEPYVDGAPRAGVRVISWGDPSEAKVTATVYTNADHSETAEITLGYLTESIMDFSFTEVAAAARAAGSEFYGAESVKVAWNGTVPSVAEVSMLDTVSDPDNNPDYEPTSEVDKTALNEAIDNAKATDTTGKTEESVAALTKAIEAAQAVADDPDATEQDVADAIAALQAAVEGLEDVTVDPDPGTDPDQPGTDEPGTDPDKPGTDGPGTGEEPGDTTDPDDQKPGTDPDDQEPGGDTTKPGPQEPSDTEIPKTGDPASLVAVLATAAVGAGALAASRKRR